MVFFPQLRLSDNRLMDDVIGYSRFTHQKRHQVYNLNLPTGLIVISSESEKEVNVCLKYMGTDAVLIRLPLHPGNSKNKRRTQQSIIFSYAISDSGK